MSRIGSIKLSDGNLMPLIGYGTWRCEKPMLKDSVIAAISAGYRHLDCAALYANEDVIGEAIKHCVQTGICSREELFITTKVMPTDMHVHKIAAAVSKSMTDLGVDYLDLVLLHWPFRFVEKPSEFPVPLAQRLGYDADIISALWRCLEDEHDAKRVKSLGVSNFTRTKLGKLLESARVKPVNNQLELHPALSQDAVLAWHAERGIIMTGYCPLGSPARPPAFRHDADPDILGHDTVLDLAKQHGKAPAQVVLKWAIQRGTVPLPKSTTPSRIIENLAGADSSWELNSEDMELMAALNTGYRFNRGGNFAVEGQTWEQLWDDDL